MDIKPAAVFSIDAAVPLKVMAAPPFAAVMWVCGHTRCLLKLSSRSISTVPLHYPTALGPIC